ncbi:site-specific integrase [Paucihalobacter ruber]|uniref:Site-specific integrase n=1 Tax=Paucihalobacter ruber TaxID=2567861 RepID=A0A506PFV8_9FLAO|nr:site-specific integrase [Paucihalobacter ruber]TPV31947.1 site-specific integrase [Paucihalobacter ruber]
MAKLTFVLRRGKSKSASINLFFNYGTKKRLRYSTGLEISDFKNWDERKMRIKNVVDEVHRNKINTRLSEIQTLVEKIHVENITNGVPLNNEMLKNELDIFLNRGKTNEEEKNNNLELLPFFDWFIEHYKNNPLVSTGRPMSSGTSRTYRNSYNILKRFNDSIYSLSYDKIGVDFYDSFLKFMRENEYSLNYIGTSIKILKTIMHASFEKGFHQNLDFKKRYFKKPSEQVFNIYLNTSELQKIHELDFSNFVDKKINDDFVITSEKIDNARDLFLISANTGLRVSDFNNLSKKNIIKEKDSYYISIVTQKNSKLLTIPINKTVKAILEKRNGNPPPKMPEQHINYCLKEIGELAKINEVIEKSITKGGIKKTKKFKKFELITNHTGRRSFCTNAYKSGMPTIDIMTISGHSTEKVFYNYIKVDDIERAEKIKMHKFFS